VSDRRYLDTSALVKLYVPEPNSAAVQAEVFGAGELLISELALLEFRSAIYGMVRSGRVTAADAAATFATFAATASSYMVLPMGSQAIRRAQTLLDLYAVGQGLKPLDALQVAVAEIENQVTLVDVFISTDVVQRHVALLTGFVVRP
jgi:predicted nucleic acid-binding protein